MPHAVEVIHTTWRGYDDYLRALSRRNSRINRGKEVISNVIRDESELVKKDDIIGSASDSR
jgi:hypothetical protein